MRLHNQLSRFSGSAHADSSRRVATMRFDAQADRALAPHPSNDDRGNRPVNATARACAISPAERELFDGEGARRRWAVRLWWTMVAVVTLGWLLGGVASAQRFETFELPERFAAFKDEKRARDLERSVVQLKTTRDLAKLDPKVLPMARFYLQTYIPWKLTQRENLPQLSKVIEDLIKDVDGAQVSSSPAALDLLKSTYLGMKELAEGNYMPAVRINAVNALSRLNSRPQDLSTGRPPLPLKNSYSILFKLYANEKENEGVRAASLHGIHHYVQFAYPTLSPEEKQALTNEMTKLLSSETPENRDPKAHAYLQRFAVDILNYLRAPNDAALGTQLISISTTEDKPDLIALYSASKLGGFEKELQGKVNNPDDITQQWSLRAFNALESELARFKAQKRPTAAMNQPPNPLVFLEKSVKTKKKTPAAGRRGMGANPDMGGAGMDMEGDYGMDSPYGGSGMMEPGMDMDMGMGMDMGYGMYGGGRTVEIPPQPPEVDLSRRKLTFVFQQLMRGATGSPKGKIAENPKGLIAAVPPAQRKPIEQWVTKMLEVNTAINDDSLSTLEKWLETLVAQRPTLGKLAGVEIEDLIDPDEIDIAPRLPGMPGMGLPGMGAGMPAAPRAGMPAAPGAGMPAAPGAGMPAAPGAGVPAAPGAGMPAAPGGLPAAPGGQ